ncbi:Trifunctional enzyme subunit alpha, mitochondrial [Dirofilaria immitis]|nr:Trifunctional enzyme subunit alpha, mitochondrial [Dirofilaria immitis]
MLFARVLSVSYPKYFTVPILENIARFASTNVYIKPDAKPEVIVPKHQEMVKSDNRETVTLKIEDNIAIVKIDLPNAKENILNEIVGNDLRYCMERIESDASIKGVVIISGKPNTFIAGADIGMLSKCKSSADARKISSDGQRDFLRIENSEKPIVAAIMGTCMGGGLELALACHYRIAMNVPKTLFALPEVKLGLLPGAGGTQRLPRLVSITDTLNMMLTGKTLSAMKAKKIGLIDRIVQPIGAGVAIEAVKQLSAGELELGRKGSLWKKATDYILMRTPVMKMTFGNYPAPLKILDVIETGITKGPDLGYLEESEAFGELTQTTQCKALMGIFKGRTEKLAVIGAGLMGAGIASVSIDKDIQTYLMDTNDEGMARATYTYSDLSECDVAIEAVFEELSLKHEIINKLEAVVPKHCIIASNTSALPITQIASVSTRPEHTSKEAIAIATQLGLAQNKLVVVVKDCPGFFVVRCLAPMMSEIGRLLQEGVHPNEIDKMTKNYGFPVGAATLADEVGIDVAQHVAKFLQEALGPRIGGGSIALLEEMIASGFKGRKSGKGYFIYNDSKKLGVFGKRNLSGVADRQLRMLCRYVNEAAICLEEGVISTPLDGDTASVFGIGFPPFWGGPFRFIDMYGADKLISNMLRYAEAYSPEQFKPAQIIQDHAKQNIKFYPD